MKSPLKKKSPIILAGVLTLMASCLAVGNPQIMRFIIDRALPDRNVDLLLLLSVLSIVAFLLQQATLLLQNMQVLKLYNILNGELRVRFLNNILRMYRYRPDHPTDGELQGLMNDDLNRVAAFRTLEAFNGAYLLGNVLASVAVVIATNWLMAALLAALLPVVMVLTRVFSPQIRKYDSELFVAQSKLSECAKDLLGSTEAAQMIGCRRFWIARYVRLMKDAFGKQTLAQLFGLKMQVVAASINYVPMSIVTFVGGILIVHGVLTLGALVAILSYFANVIQPVQQVLEINKKMQLYKASAARTLPFLDAQDADDRPIPPMSVDGLVFNGVSFRYPGEASGFRLSSITLSFEPGKFYVLRGRNGSGKSTFLKLAIALLAPSEGAVRVEPSGPDTSVEAVFSHVFSVLPASSMLFAGSIWENVTLGAACDRGTVLGLAESLFPDLMAFDFFDVEIDPRKMLSSGQARKVEILRTLLLGGRVAILDEPERGLDEESVARLGAFLRARARYGIVIAASHSEAMREAADAVIDL